MAECNVAADDMKHCYENLILIDAGANLTNKKYSRDLDAVIQRAQDSGKWAHHIFLPYSIILWLMNAMRTMLRCERITQCVYF